MCLSVVLGVVVMGVSGFSPVANCMVVRFRWLICTRWTQAVPVLKVMLLPFQGAACGVNAVTQGVASLALGYGLDGLSARLPCVFSRALGAFLCFAVCRYVLCACFRACWARCVCSAACWRASRAWFPACWACCVCSAACWRATRVWFPARWAHCVHFAACRDASCLCCSVCWALSGVSRFGLYRSVRRSALKGQQLIAQGIALGEGAGGKCALKGQKHCSAKQSSPVPRHFSQAVRAVPGGCAEKKKTGTVQHVFACFGADEFL